MITAETLRTVPATDPTEIYRHRDGLYAADLLTAAGCHLGFFDWLRDHPADAATIARELGVQARPLDVLLTLLTAMNLIEQEGGIHRLTRLGREHWCSDSPWCVAAYFASVKDRPVCRDMVEVLRSGRPANWASLRDEKEWAKAMESPDFANRFTAAMDCRGVFLAPAMAAVIPGAGRRHLLDIAGGSGIYACAMTARHEGLRATVLERPPVDGLAARLISERGFAGRVGIATGDIFRDPFPAGADLHLFSNVLHDWDTTQVAELLAKSFATLEPGGLVLIHDAHINAAKTGPLPVAAYSALLMTITEGKCYSEKELADLLEAAGFREPRLQPTAADRSVIVARKL